MTETTRCDIRQARAVRANGFWDERNTRGKFAMPQEHNLTVITDLTTRLREGSALYIEAADEIERLRTALIVAREFALWPACAAELQRVLSSIDEVLS